MEKLEDITSKEYLDKALENAKSWCLINLPNYIQDFQGIDYNIFHYIIDNKMFGSDMRLDEEQPGLIRVSTRKLKWYLERENHFKEYGVTKPETDPESMFVHEITEFIIDKIPEVYLHYISKMEFPHSVARKIENINRKERGLGEWVMD